jgi:Flp pilus assembly pilin Flp
MVDRLNSLIVGTYVRLTSVDLRREEGQALTEYALVLALIVVGGIVALNLIGVSITNKLKDVCHAVAGATASCG